MEDVIRGERLTTFDIEPDGSRFCMNVADTSGSPRGLSLPAECLTQLIMTLPEMATRLLKVCYRDDTMRIVYPLGHMSAEASHVENITILTLTTIDGFAVSFGMTVEDLKRLERAASEARTGMRPKFVKN
jgi:hypothetical protein